tara:strand:- start:109 stop:243 length:135 start_codon:yes stop_codon:yes gene_type:complete
VLRVFRVFRLVNVFAELNELLAALRNTSRSIFVFQVMLVVVVLA